MKRIVTCAVFLLAALCAAPASAQETVESLTAKVAALTARVSAIEADLVTKFQIDHRAVPADYDGDGLTDPAVFYPSSGVWRIKYSGGAATAEIQWGVSTDVVAPGDYDGDGLADLGAYRASNGVLYIRYATGATAGIQMRAQ